MKRHLLQAALLLVVSVSVGSTTAAQSSGGNVEKFALVTGIKGYPNFPPDERLNYADSDAKAFRDFILTPAGGSFPEENVKLLLNEEATREGIYNKIEWLSRVTRPYGNAVVYVFFAGHGVADDEERAYLMPFDARKDSPFSTGGIRANRFLQDLEESVNARHLVLFIDACHAGAVVSANGTARGGPNVSKEFLQTWNQSLNEAQGIHMGLLSATSNQRSYEDHGLKQGLFTHFLLMGLKGKADRNPKDGRVDAGELHRYVLEEVDGASRSRFEGRQTPIVSPKFDASLTLSMTPSMKALNPQLRHVKFFDQGSGNVPAKWRRRYNRRFSKSRTRYVNWELGLKIPAPGAEVNVKVEAVWSRPDGSTYRESVNGLVRDNWTDVYFTGGGYGYSEPGNWSTGSYRVDFFLDGDRFATKSFRVSSFGGSGQSSGSSDPAPFLGVGGSGPLFNVLPPTTFRTQNPKLSFVKFFELGKGEIPPPAQRKYAAKFSTYTARYIYWEIEILMTAPPVDFDFKIDTVWYGPDGGMLWKESVPTRMSKDWKGFNRVGPGYGWEDASHWKPGEYRVDFFVGEEKIASESFRIT